FRLAVLGLERHHGLDLRRLQAEALEVGVGRLLRHQPVGVQRAQRRQDALDRARVGGPAFEALRLHNLPHGRLLLLRLLVLFLVFLLVFLLFLLCFLLLALDDERLAAAGQFQLGHLGVGRERRQRAVEERQRPFRDARQERLRHRQARLLVADLAPDVDDVVLLLAEDQPHRRRLGLQCRLGVGVLLLLLLLGRLVVLLLLGLGVFLVGLLVRRLVVLLFFLFLVLLLLFLDALDPQGHLGGRL